MRFIFYWLLFFLNLPIVNLLFLNFPLLSLLFPTLHSIPIAAIKTIRLVPPALTNGSGIPVGGIEPVNTSYYIIKLDNKKEQNLLLFFVIIYLFLRITIAIEV